MPMGDGQAKAEFTGVIMECRSPGADDPQHFVAFFGHQRGDPGLQVEARTLNHQSGNSIDSPSSSISLPAAYFRRGLVQ